MGKAKLAILQEHGKPSSDAQTRRGGGGKGNPIGEIALPHHLVPIDSPSLFRILCANLEVGCRTMQVFALIARPGAGGRCG